MERREYLARLAPIGAASLAGCYSSSDSGTSSKSIPAPEIRDLDEEAWELLNDEGTILQRELSPAGVDIGSVYNRTVLYEYLPVKNRVRSRTLGQFKSEIVAFFASRLQLEGASGFIRPVLVKDQVDQQVRNRVEGMGVHRVRKAGKLDEIQVNTGETATVQRFRGTYTKRNIPFSVTIPEEGERTLRFDAVRVSVEVISALWKHDGQIFVAGGAYPSENIQESKRIDITGGKRRGIDVKILLNIQFNRNELRERITRLIKSVT